VKPFTPTLALLAALLLPPPALAQQAVNPIHPLFAPLDAAGKPARTSGEVSPEKTCGACHDAAWIGAHTAHGAGPARATCLQCHVDGGALDLSPGALSADGRLRRDFVRIGAPKAASCGTCHGLVVTGPAPALLPSDFEAAPAPGRTWSLTQGEGAIVSSQRMVDSFLNLAGKGDRTGPWDVHAAKLVDCVACHYAGNNPARTDQRREELRYVTNDPRRLSTAEFLLRPDHRLAAPDCRACHDAQKTHAFLPYRERHMEVLACQACHAPDPVGPAAEMIDATVATLGGTPMIHFRNLERTAGEPLNAATVRPLRPLLVVKAAPGGARRLTPVNVVARWRWVSRADGQELPFALVARAFAEGGAFAPAVLAALDADRDGTLSPGELRLDDRAKAEVVAGRLRALGAVDPVIDGLLEPHVLAHGIQGRAHALRDCNGCHAAGARLGGDFPVAPFVPGGVAPRPPDARRIDLAGTIGPTSAGGLAFRRAPDAAPGGLHVLGHSRQAWTNQLGFLLFLAVFGGVTVHGLGRWLLRRRARAALRARGGHAPARREYVFGRYERLWHWTMAFSGLVLILTGVAVHGGAASWPVDLAGAVSLHNLFAIALMVNAFLALFYHLATAAIRNFVPHPRGLLARVLEHVQYQSRGIFYGDPHPENPAGHKLNPLQQLTYLALLNVLFPVQIASGLLIWAVGHWPAVAAAVGGLQVVAPLHNLGAWLFLTFLVLHVYLVTTGRTVGDHLRSMVTGYQTVDADETEPQGA
jgi:thiosulfate reductase cytochrome b subunit